MKNFFILGSLFLSLSAFADSKSYSVNDSNKTIVIATLKSDQKVELKLGLMGTSLKLLVDGKKSYVFNLPGINGWQKGYLEEVLGSRVGHMLSSEELSTLECKDNNLKITGRVEELPANSNLYAIDPDRIEVSCL